MQKSRTAKKAQKVVRVNHHMAIIASIAILILIAITVSSCVLSGIGYLHVSFGDVNKEQKPEVDKPEVDKPSEDKAAPKNLINDSQYYKGANSYIIPVEVGKKYRITADSSDLIKFCDCAKRDVFVGFVSINGEINDTMDLDIVEAEQQFIAEEFDGLTKLDVTVEAPYGYFIATLPPHEAQYIGFGLYEVGNEA